MEIVKRNQTGFQVLPKRWIIERTLVWLGINRRLAKDVERFSATSLSFIQTAMIKLMTRRQARIHPFLNRPSVQLCWTHAYTCCIIRSICVSMYPVLRI